ncbi:MAG: hypothetical protein V4760_13750 [Bdellovibrionota bacterium]
MAGIDADFVANFKAPLEELERERLKVRRDRRGFLFIALLLKTMALVCSLSALAGRSTFLVVLALVMIAGSFVALFLREKADARYQDEFREKVTRRWFHERFLGVFLAAPPKDLSANARYLLGHSKFARGRLEDRVYFDRETEDSHIYVTSRGRKRFLSFMKMRSGVEHAPPEELMAALARFGKVHWVSGRDGLWVALRLRKRLFSAPVETETSDSTGYADWVEDAKILLDPEVRLHWIGAR